MKISTSLQYYKSVQLLASTVRIMASNSSGLQNQISVEDYINIMVGLLSGWFATL